MLTRKRQVVVAVESSEGTAETPSAADGKMECYDLDVAVTPDIFERNPARTYLSQLPGIVGKQSMRVSWRTELKGSGTAATRPAWDKALRACGFSGASVHTIGIGSTISSGPFQPGETVTGSSSAATGRVVVELASGTTTMHLVPTSSTFNTDDEITGGTSGATVSVSRANAASKGWEYRPVSSGVPSVTVAGYKDGLRAVGCGGRGSVTVNLVDGEPGFLSFAFDLVYSTCTDAALLTITHYTTNPPAFLDSGHRFDGDTTPLVNVGIDAGNTVTPREDARNAKGIKSYLITERKPTLTLDPECVLVATKSRITRMLAATTGYFFAKAGSTAGNRVGVSSPKIQYVASSEGDRGGIATDNLTFNLVSASANAGDNELAIYVV